MSPVRKGMIEVPRLIATEALAAISLRTNWYETRGYAVPTSLMNALRYLAEALGVDPLTLEARKP